MTDNELNELVEVLTEYIDQEIQKKSNLIFKTILKKIQEKNLIEDSSKKNALKEKLKKQIFTKGSKPIISENNIHKLNEFETVDIKKTILEGKDPVEELIQTDYREMLKKLK